MLTFFYISSSIFFGRVFCDCKNNVHHYKKQITQWFHNNLYLFVMVSDIHKNYEADNFLRKQNVKNWDIVIYAITLEWFKYKWKVNNVDRHKHPNIYCLQNYDEKYERVLSLLCVSLIVCETFFNSVLLFFVHSAFFIVRQASFRFLLGSFSVYDDVGLLTNSVFCFSRRAELNGFKWYRFFVSG